MAQKSERKALGRGLSALLGDQAKSAPPTRGSGGDEPPSTAIPIDLIDANPQQPRTNFKDADLDELAASLKRHGVIQPIVLRPAPSVKGRYQIVAGERRWRAAQRAGLHELPAVVRDIDDRQILELAIIENVQRVDLDPIEEAQGYRQLIDSFDYTQAELADVVGKSRSHVANMMRLLALPDQVIRMVRDGKLSAGHARALINAADPVGLAEQAVLRGLTVRQVEDLARKVPEARAATSQRKPVQKDADTRMLEGDLSATIGMRVQIEHAAGGGGELRIRYKDLEGLDRLCRKLSE